MFRLLLFFLAFTATISAQTSAPFFSTFDAERGNVLIPSSDGNLWLGAMKNDRVLLVKISPTGQVLLRRSIRLFDASSSTFEGDYLIDLLETSDGRLVGCGNFENDNAGRSFVFSYDPVQQSMYWSHIIQSNINSVSGITELGNGGDYVLYSNPRFSGGDDTDILQLERTSGNPVPGKAKRYHLGISNNLLSIVYHQGALYACGRFTNGLGSDGSNRMRNTLCKIDTATFEPSWTKLSPFPTAASARLFGRDLIIDNEQIVSTFSGDPSGPDLFSSTVFLQKNDLNGNLLWVRHYDLPEWNGEFAEEVISLPDGYMLYGHELLDDAGRLFLLKTDKEGHPLTAVKIDFGTNDDFADIPARSKILLHGDALFLTAFSEDNLGQPQGILIKTNLDGWVGDSCGYVTHTPVEMLDLPNPVSEDVSPTITNSGATSKAVMSEFDIPDLTFSKTCGATGTCPTLPDLRLTLDSITCGYGEPRLHYTICNVGGQTLETAFIFGLYDKNPLTDSARLVTAIVYTQNSIAPGDCLYDSLGSDLAPPTAFLLDTFSRLYGLVGTNFADVPPILLSSFPLSPNGPECAYLNNLDSIAVPAQLCSSCENPSTFVKKMGSPQESELAFSMCRSIADGNVYIAGRKGIKPMITKMTPNGQIIWVRDFPGNPNELIELAEIIEDSDGNLLICGTQGSALSSRRTVVLRYDPVADLVLWYKQIVTDHPEANGILEKSPGGNFILRTNNRKQVGGFKAWADLIELDRETGAIVPSGVTLRFIGDQNLNFQAMDKEQDSLFSLGGWSTNNGRYLLSKLSITNGQPEWTRLITADTTLSVQPMVSFNDITRDDSETLLVGTGPKDPLNPIGDIYIYLAKHTFDGSLIWLKRYDFPVEAEDVVEVFNAYVIFGKIHGTNSWGLLKVDKNGNVLAAKSITTAVSSPINTNYANRQNQMIKYGDHLMMVTVEELPPSNDIILIKTDFDLELADSCSLMQNVSVPVYTMPAKATPETLPTQILSTDVIDANATFQADSLAVNQLCPQCLPCAGEPDLALGFQGIICDSGSLVAVFDLCNTGMGTFSGPANLAIYASNPFGPTAQLEQVKSVTNLELAPDSCQQVQVILPFAQNFTNYGLFSSGLYPSAMPPLAAEDIPLPDGTAECNIDNNLSTFGWGTGEVPNPPDLGPDRIICTGTTAVLDAGNGYALYQWVGGPATRTYAVNLPGTYIVEVTEVCGQKSRDTIHVTVLPALERTQTIEFYPGDTIVIDSVAYTQSDTVVQSFTSVSGCDSLVTNILQLILTDITVSCPADLTVTLPLNMSTTVVDYNLPTATTNCPDSTIQLTLLQGLPVGGAFPQGTTQVCYEAANQCGTRDTCCFRITAQQSDPPCDVKTPPGCLRYELLSIRLDSLGQRRYRVRFVNTCNSPLQYTYIQLPNGVNAVAPAEGVTYTAPGSNTYFIRNPNASPFYSIRFKAVTGELNNGKNDIFEYTLPQQSAPDYIHVAAKLEDGSYSEAHLNTFDCPVQPYVGMLNPGVSVRSIEKSTDVHAVWPNPTTGILFIGLHGREGQELRIQVLNSQGQLVSEANYKVDQEVVTLHLPPSLVNGLYYLVIQTPEGRQIAERFVLAHE